MDGDLIENSVEKCEVAPPGVSKWGKDNEVLDFLCQDSRVPFFFLTLFVEFSPSYGHAMAVPANFRKVDLKEITRREGKTSLLETLANSSDNSVLDQTIFVYPYEVTFKDADHHQRQNATDELAPIISLTRGNYQNGKEEKHGQLQFLRSCLCAAHVSQGTYVRTCNLLSAKPRQFEEFVLNDTHVFNDWSTMFGNAYLATGRSIEALRAFVQSLKITSDPLKDVTDQTSLEECHALVREAVQKETPLRFAMLEGNHRMETLVRLFYGVGFDEISHPTFGMDFRTPASRNKEIVMYKQTHVRVCENPGKRGFILNSDLPTLSEFSEYLTSKRKQLVKSSWRHLLIDAVTKVTELRSWKDHMARAQVVWSAKIPASVKTQHSTPWAEHHKWIGSWLLKFMLHVEPSISDKAPEAAPGQASNFDTSVAKYDSKVLFCPYTTSQNGYPDFNQAKRNMNIKCFKSILPSIVMWLVQLFGTHKESFSVLEKFLQTPHEYMKDLEFLAIYVCGPINKITELVLDATCLELETQGMLKLKQRSAMKYATVDKQRLEHYIRLSYAMYYLRFLTNHRMSFKFKDGTSNCTLRTWMEEGDLGFDENSKNMLRNHRALCYNNDTKIVFSTFPKYVERALKKKTLIKSHHVVSQWWKASTSDGIEVTTIAKMIFPSLRKLAEQKELYEGKFANDEDYVYTLIPPTLRFDDSMVKKIAKGEVDLTKAVQQTDFMSPKEQARWLRDQNEAALYGNNVDEKTKIILMDTYDEKANRIQEKIRTAHVDFTQSSDESSNSQSNDEDYDEENDIDADEEEDEDQVISDSQMSAFETICEEVEAFVTESPAKTTKESKKLQTLVKDYTSYTRDFMKRFRQIWDDGDGPPSPPDPPKKPPNVGSPDGASGGDTPPKKPNERSTNGNENEATNRDGADSDSDADYVDDDDNLSKNFVPLTNDDAEVINAGSQPTSRKRKHSKEGSPRKSSRNKTPSAKATAAMENTTENPATKSGPKNRKTTKKTGGKRGQTGGTGGKRGKGGKVGKAGGRK